MFSSFVEERDNRKENPLSFLSFILKPDNRLFCFVSIIVGVVYFVLLRKVFPVPTFNNDSYSWITAAKNHLPVTYRPIFYSLLLRIFKHFSTSVTALIAGQYCINLFSNLFLFFTCCYFFKVNKVFKLVLYGFLIIHPFYLLSSNYVMSDPFFNGFAVLWFTLLIWILYKPSVYLILAQLAVLSILFQLRFNAVIFPVVIITILTICKLPLYKKVAYIAVHLLVIFSIALHIINTNKHHTGFATLSAFGGWQLANDAMHVFRYHRIDTSATSNPETKKLIVFASKYFDTATKIPDGATAFYFDRFISPLQKYMAVYNKDNTFFQNWNALAPIYNDFGKTVILHHPVAYCTYFILPNTKAYFFPPLEAYKGNNVGNDTIRKVAQKYYGYINNVVPVSNPKIYFSIFNPIPYLFAFIHLALIVLIFCYWKFKHYQRQSKLFNQSLLCFCALTILNFAFIVTLAPTVLRYHNFILTVSFLFTVLLLGQFGFVRRNTWEFKWLGMKTDNGNAIR